MSADRQHPKVRRPFPTGTVILWLIMLGMIGGAVAEFYGPHQGWFVPAVDRTRVVVASTISDVQRWLSPPPPPSAAQPPPVAETPATATPTTIVSVEGSSASAEATPKSRSPATGTAPNGRAKGTVARGKPTEAPVPKATGAPAAAPEPADEGDYAKLYEQFMQEELAKLPKPKTGKIYTIPTTIVEPETFIAAPTYHGMLMVLGNDRLVLKTDKRGDVTITPDMLEPKYVMQFFPKQYARGVVVAKLDRLLGDQLAQGKTAPAKPVAPAPGTQAVAALPPAPPAGTEAVVEEVETPGEAVAVSSGPLTKYDPSKAKTPAKYTRSLKQYGQWLEMQGRRVGGTIATELYAKEYGKQVVLYAVMHDNFVRQSHEIRELTTEMLWRMWSRRMREDGKVGALQDAHLVLLDKRGAIIGGSKVTNASELWVKL